MLQDLQGSEAIFDTLSVRDVFNLANLALGGPVVPFSVQNVFQVVGDINRAFNGGAVSTFGQENLALPASATPAPEPSSWTMLLVGFAGLGFARRQGSWRDKAGDLLTGLFDRTAGRRAPSAS